MNNYKSYLFIGGHNQIEYRIIEDYREYFDIYVKDDYTIVNDVLSYYPTEMKIERYFKDCITYRGFTYYFFRISDKSVNECLKIIFGNSEVYESQYK